MSIRLNLCKTWFRSQPYSRHKVAPFSRTPQAININDVRTNAACGSFKKPMFFGGLKKQPLFLS